MQGLVFWIVYPFLWLISILPFPIFYQVSNFAFFLTYHVFKYRRKTVDKNLRLVFPDKNDKERAAIRKKFYVHMCDMFLEMVKTISISEKEIQKRFAFTNPEEVQKILNIDKSVVLMCGHYASYEWIIALKFQGMKHKAHGIYKKIKNRYFDQMVKDIRQKFDNTMLTTLETPKVIKKNQENGIKSMYAMIADQSPKKANSKYWIDFMGIRVPVFLGSEKMAKDFDMAVVYLHVEKPKRGYYQTTLIPITENPAQEPDFYITKKYIRLLEKQIKSAPEYYLWTHKRWKHRNRKIPKNANIIR